MRTASFADLAAMIRARPTRAGATRIISIDGPAGAGKVPRSQGGEVEGLRGHIGCELTDHRFVAIPSLEVH